MGRDEGGLGKREHTIRTVLFDKCVQREAGGNLTCAELTGLKYAGLPLSEMKYFYLY